jgi:hypothetical protein
MPRSYNTDSENALYQDIYEYIYSHPDQYIDIPQVGENEADPIWKVIRPKDQDAALSEARIKDIFIRAKFDVLLTLTAEGKLNYHERFVVIQQAGQVNGVSTIAGNGDASRNDKVNATFAGLQVPDLGLLLNIYWREPVTKEAALNKAIDMINDGKIT